MKNEYNKDTSIKFAKREQMLILSKKAFLSGRRKKCISFFIQYIECQFWYR